jgi:hypothetical protein
MRKVVLSLAMSSAFLTGFMPTIALASACTGNNNCKMIGTVTSGGNGCGGQTSTYAIVC